jgi:hypothetical protein
MSNLLITFMTCICALAQINLTEGAGHHPTPQVIALALNQRKNLQSNTAFPRLTGSRLSVPLVNRAKLSGETRTTRSKQTSTKQTCPTRSKPIQSGFVNPVPLFNWSQEEGTMVAA